MTAILPDWLGRLHALVRDRVYKPLVRDELLQVGRHIYADARHERDWFRSLAEACVYVGDEYAAMQTLTHFARSVLDARTAPWLERLRDAFGIDWFRDVWSQMGKWGVAFDWTLDLVTELDVQVLQTLLETYELTDEHQQTLDTVQTVLKAYLKVQGKPVVPEKWLHALESWAGAGKKPFPVLEMAQFLVRYAHVDGLEGVKKIVLHALDAELAALDDPGWSLETVCCCQCRVCSAVVEFLHSKSRVKFERRMPVLLMRHATARWQAVCKTLPLEWTVKKCVRPYAWVLVKQWWIPQEWPRRQRYRACVACRDALARRP